MQATALRRFLLIDSLFFPDPPNSAAKADTNIDRHL